MLSSSTLFCSALFGAAAAQLYPGLSDLNHTCVIDPKVRSCPAANPFKVDSCCEETFGGLVLQTQFWQTYTGLESEGQLIPPNTWTVHGLWPDFCNGSYTQYCDLTRQYDPDPSPKITNFPRNGTVVPPYKGTGVAQFIKDFGRYDLLEWMNHNWVNQGAPNEDFWAHEFSKHATCYSTFQVPCFGPQYVPHQEVIQFYETVIKYYLRYPTFEWLADAGITPSNHSQVSLFEVQDVLTIASGAIPYIGCSGPRYNTTEAGKNSNDNGRTVISEVWYYNNVYGRVQDGIKVPVDATGSTSSCAQALNALWYYEVTNTSLFPVGINEGYNSNSDDEPIFYSF